MPRWVKIGGIAALVLALVIFGVMLFSGGEHGPGRHSPLNGAGLTLLQPVSEGDQLL